MERPFTPTIYNPVSITWVYRRVYPRRPRARGTRERKGDDKSGRTRRIEKVAPVGPGNGIPVLDSAGNPRRYRVTKRRSAGTIVRAITTGDIGKTGRIYRILTRCVRARENIFDRIFFIAYHKFDSHSNADPQTYDLLQRYLCFITQECCNLYNYLLFNDNDFKFC